MGHRRPRSVGVHKTGSIPRHVWIIGKTGSGKSTLLANLFAQDAAAGHGAALLDPHGDLVDAVLPLVPRPRINDTLLFAPADREWPVSFNVLREGRSRAADTALLTSGILSVFKKQWSDSWGPRLEHVLRNALLAVTEFEASTLLTLYRFLTDEAFRDRHTPQLRDPAVRAFWEREFPGYSRSLQAEAVAPVLNKLGAFVSQPLVRAIVGQERSRVNLAELMGRRGLLLASLATGRIGEDASHLLGGLLLTAMQLASMARPRGGPPFYVYVDEFQHFVTDSLATLLAESRKFGIGLTLAHQYLGQLPLPLRDAVLGNVGSLVVFRLGAGDAAELEGEFLPVFTAVDLQRFERYHAAVKLHARGETLAPFTARMLPPTSPPADAGDRIRAIREQSRQRYAESRAFVDARIAETFGNDRLAQH